MEKGNQGAQQYVWAIIPKKKPHRKLFTLDDNSFNAAVEINHLIVEIFSHYTKHKTIQCYFSQNTGGQKKGKKTSFVYVLGW